MLTRGAQVTGVAVCSLCLSWISVVLRFYVRVRILKFFGREDWLTVATMVCANPVIHDGTGNSLNANADETSNAKLQTGNKKQETLSLTNCRCSSRYYAFCAWS